MARARVKLTYITHEGSRKASYKKRKKGLLKKVEELSILCDVDACAIVRSSLDSEPEVWPSPEGVRRVIERFRNVSEMDKAKRTVDQQSFLRQRITKVQAQLKKLLRDNWEKKISTMMYRAIDEGGSIRPSMLEGMDPDDFGSLVWMVDKTLKEIEAAMRPSQQMSQPAVLPSDPTGDVDNAHLTPQQTFQLGLSHAIWNNPGSRYDKVRSSEETIRGVVNSAPPPPAAKNDVLNLPLYNSNIRMMMMHSAPPWPPQHVSWPPSAPPAYLPPTDLNAGPRQNHSFPWN
ncbi:hypothetical protein SAY86_029332 [Trapa natans]|uniref:MADS-box domain-containing protein n=1 Tax=Trapa natans TaxID=22666 RepID=A0AAN7M119_TRANT|nr:hypothetical protein SAY86_029332 [Trapa natans]